MERLTATNNIALLTPVIVGKGSSDKISLILRGAGGSLAGLALYVVGPLGQVADITGYLAEITTSLTFITLFEANYTFASPGRFKFILHDTVSGDAIISATDVPEWTGNIDMPISDIAKQRVDIQRIFGRIKQGV